MTLGSIGKRGGGEAALHLLYTLRGDILQQVTTRTNLADCTCARIISRFFYLLEIQYMMQEIGFVVYEQTSLNSYMKSNVLIMLYWCPQTSISHHTDTLKGISTIKCKMQSWNLVKYYRGCSYLFSIKTFTVKNWFFHLHENIL